MLSCIWELSLHCSSDHTGHYCSPSWCAINSHADLQGRQALRKIIWKTMYNSARWWHLPSQCNEMMKRCFLNLRASFLILHHNCDQLPVFVRLCHMCKTKGLVCALNAHWIWRESKFLYAGVLQEHSASQNNPKPNPNVNLVLHIPFATPQPPPYSLDISAPILTCLLQCHSCPLCSV